MLPPFAMAVAARLTGVLGVTDAPVAGVSRLTIGGWPTGVTTSSGTWTSRAAPALSVARAPKTSARLASPGFSSGAA